MMKRTLLLFPALCCGALTAVAQDLIVKTDAAQIEAKVTEITPDAVRYKRFSNPEGPTYVLPVGEIDYIRYANGEKEVFRKSAAPAAPAASNASASSGTSAPAAPASDSASAAAQPAAPAQYVLKRYEVGDLYDYNGLKGVVCQVTDDGLHGLLVSLDEVMIPWSTFRKPELRTVGTSDRMDGRANMETVARYIAENNLSWDDFPAFKWCRELGEGWYLPAIDEMLTIGHNYNGGTRIRNNRQARIRFNGTLKEAGGERMDRMVYYFSSTECDDKNAFTTHMGLEPPYVIEIPKYNKFLVRAVHRF